MSDSFDPTFYEQPAADPPPCACVETVAEPVVVPPVEDVAVDPVETYAAPATPEPVVQSAPVVDASPPLPEPVVQTTVVSDAWTPPAPEPAGQTMVVGNAWGPDPTPIAVASPTPAPQVFEVGPASTHTPPAEPAPTAITPYSPFSDAVTEVAGPSAPTSGTPTVAVIGNGTDGDFIPPTRPDDFTFGDLANYGVGVGVRHTGNAALDGIVGYVGVQAHRNVLSTPTPNDIILDS